jgi:murein L,D-transpeptidase YafK
VFLLFVIVVLNHFDKSTYIIDMVHKIEGKQTVESIVNHLEVAVSERLRNALDEAGFEDYPNEVILVGLKEEELLQIYGRSESGIKFIKQYPFTANSGILGPKLKEGDLQIPEGIYKIEYLNPNSSYYLSLKVSYPNEFDKLKTKFDEVIEMGGDIFIHGKSVTIGCIPIGDFAIEEVFMLVHKAMNKDTKVIISPRDFRVKDEYPNVESVEWEGELYDMIKEELVKMPS